MGRNVICVLGISVICHAAMACSPPVRIGPNSGEPRPAAARDTVVDQAVGILASQLWNGRAFRWDSLRRLAESGGGPPSAIIRRLLDRVGDPANRLLARTAFDALLGDMTGTAPVGVGLAEVLSFDVDHRTGAVAIVTPIEGSAAAAAGLAPGDVLTAIDGRPVANRRLDEIAAWLRRPSGPAVRIAVTRQGDRREVKLRRSQGALPASVSGYLLDRPNAGIGVLRLRQFTQGSEAEVEQELARLKGRGARALVLDLRNNPGGLVEPCLAIAGLFVGRRPLALIHTADREADTLWATGDPGAALPLAVLINAGTASAAEVLAAGLRSVGGATVFGERSYGKGLVHGAFPLADGSVLLLSVGRIRTLEGRDLLDEAIAPDSNIPSISGSDRTLQAAVDFLSQSAR